MSGQEKVSWVSLLVGAVLYAAYFSRVFALPGDSRLFGPGMAAFALVLIMAAIAIGGISELLLRWVQARAGDDPERRDRPDERDQLINLRAGRNAYGVLAVGIAVVLGVILNVQSMRVPASTAATVGHTVLMRMLTGPLDPPLIAQWLLLALSLASLCRYGTRIVCYRRGY